MKHLERAHALAHEAGRALEEAEPNALLPDAARRIEAGIVAIYDAIDGRADRVTSITAAHARLWDAAIASARAGVTSALGSLKRACDEALAAEERFPRVQLAPRVEKPFFAGDREPPLHQVERASLVPSLRVPEAPEPPPPAPAQALPMPKNFDEVQALAEATKKLADEKIKAMLAAPPPRAITRADLERKNKKPEEELPPEGFAEHPPASLARVAFIQKWARECFDEVGMLGIQRAPLAGDDWREIATLDRRMVWSIDAVAAMGPDAIAFLEPYAMDAPAADPVRVFAVTMIAGCLEGRDVLGGAERVLHRFGAGDPLVADAFVAALRLSVNPFVPSVLRALASSTDRASRLIATEVLAYRGWHTQAELEALAEERDPKILALALPALAHARHRDLHRALLLAQSQDDASLRRAALDAMLLVAHSDIVEAAKISVERGDSSALVQLAIAASYDDARWLLAHARATPSVDAAHALGWSGLVDAVPLLISWLEGEDEPRALASGAALDRLLGAGIIDAIVIMPEQMDDVPVDDPDPDAKPPRAPLADLVSDPRDKPPPGSAETLEVPAIDPQKWRAYWAEHGNKLDPKLRTRRGRPYTPAVSLDELSRLSLSLEDRRRLHRELAARTGKITRFEPHDFVATQERSLAAWASLVASSLSAEGSWSRGPAAS
jgi:hypothetical protein